MNEVLLHVSNLISIGEFRMFMSMNPNYQAERKSPKKGDCLETVNCEEDESLPAAVTWYDANAYARWFSETKELPVRLLTCDEYDKIARPIVQPPNGIPQEEFYDMNHKPLCRFYNPDGTVISEHPPYMDEIQKLNFRFIPNALEWKTSASGLKFLASQHFGEWLNEKDAAVNSFSLTCLCYLESPPIRRSFISRSTGKYKSKKIGFRLCYLGNASSIKNNIKTL